MRATFLPILKEMTVPSIGASRRAAVVVAATISLLFAGAASAPAANAAAQWRISAAVPTRIAAGDELVVRVSMRNVGDADTDGTGALDISLPPGVTGLSLDSAFGWQGAPSGFPPLFWTCSDPVGASSVHCDIAFPIPVTPNQVVGQDVIVRALVAPDAAGPRTLEVVASGGGTSAATTTERSFEVSPDVHFGVDAFDGGTFNRDGSAATQAGAHPFEASTTFTLDSVLDAGFLESDGGNLRNVGVELPAGFVGNPTAMPRCAKGLRVPSNKQAGEGGFDPNEFCPVDSVVGIADIMISLTPSGAPARFVVPVFNLEPAPGVAAQFGFSFLDVTTVLDAHVRSDGDYGVTVTARNISQARTVLGSSVTLWGSPADPSHDEQRCLAFIDPMDAGVYQVGAPLPKCDPLAVLSSPWNAPHSAGRRPVALLTNPTACTPAGVGLTTTLRVESWDPTRPPDQASFVSHLPPGHPLPLDQWGDPRGPTGCDALPFDPSMSVEPDTRDADAPTGLSFDLSFPSDGLLNPSGLSQAHLKRASVTLPEGMSISPSAADGLQACIDEQSGVGTLRAATCPSGSKVGTVEATTPLLDEVLTGGVYIGSQRSMDPASGEMFRLFLTLNSEERGIHVKLPGQVRVNPDTGRIETTFDNNPQVPVERIALRLKSGPRAPLAMPTDCGAKSIDAVFESWGGQTVARSDSFEVGCPGQTGFAPSFEAGSISPTGGRFSPFVARIDRSDRQQFLSGVRVEMPKGLIANLKGVPLCGDVQAEAGGCPAGSRIGTVTVGAGPGSSPFYLQGPVYLTEGYGGGPYGLSVQVAVKAGPFDLGLVVVRQAVHVDPRTAELRVVSDPLPQIVKGVPVRLRSAVVDVDRPSFAINPTSCAVQQVKAVLTSIQGTVHQGATRFQASDCASLGFRPRVAMRLTGSRQRRTGGHPGLRTTVRQESGQANIGRAEVALPKSVALDPRNSTDPKLVCDYDRGLAADCPASSVIGRAVARTPVLNRPLVGNVHLVQGVRFGPKGNRIRTTPTLLVKLRGEVAIDLRARTTVKRNRLVTMFEQVPDAPVSSFQLNIAGGSKGILVVTRTRRSKIDLCTGGQQLAAVETDGQNGKQADFTTPIKTPCAKQRGAKAKRRTPGSRVRRS